jgi:hypothetical protein
MNNNLIEVEPLDIINKYSQNKKLEDFNNNLQPNNEIYSQMQIDSHTYNNIDQNVTMPQDVKYEADLVEDADGMDDNMSEELNNDNGNDIADNKKETDKKGIL